MPHIAVIGTGYVGLVSGVGLADFGHYVTCVDKDNRKISLLRNGEVPIYEPELKELLDKNVTMGRLTFSEDIDYAIRESKVIFIAVGTPVQKDGTVDLTQVKEVSKKIVDNLNGYKLIVIKSTVPVGTNRRMFNFIKKRIGTRRFDVVSNPEFLREGKAVHDFFHPDRVVVGYQNEKAKDLVEDIYRSLYLIETPFIFCNWETAELIKYAGNAFLATKITFINQIADLCEKVGTDIHIVAKAIGMDGRIGSKFLHPGPGYGGSCLPKDTRALVAIAQKYGLKMSVIQEINRSNEMQKKMIVDKFINIVGNPKGKKIAVLGLAFKAGTDDIRESPSIVVIEELVKRGAKVNVHDPQALKNAKEYFKNHVNYSENEYEALKDADAMVILTEWNDYRNIDLNKCKKLMKGKIIFDLRNVLNPEDAKKIGFKYYGRGRR